MPSNTNGYKFSPALALLIGLLVGGLAVYIYLGSSGLEGNYKSNPYDEITDEEASKIDIKTTLEDVIKANPPKPEED